MHLNIKLILFYAILETARCGIWNKLGHWETTLQGMQICPRGLTSCRLDPAGFVALRSLCDLVDVDRDKLVSTGEAAAILGETAFKELMGGHRTMQTVLKSEGGDTKVQEVWDRWTDTPVYAWNSEQLANWLHKELGTDIYTKYILKDGLNGKSIARFTESDGEFTRKHMRVDDESTLKLIRNKAISLILFGEIKWIRFYLTTGHLISTTITIYAMLSTIIMLKQYALSRSTKKGAKETLFSGKINDHAQINETDYTEYQKECEPLINSINAEREEANLARFNEKYSQITSKQELDIVKTEVDSEDISEDMSEVEEEDE